MSQIDNLLMEFGKKVKTLRKMRGLSQQELGERVHIGLRQIQRIERGSADFHFGSFYSLCMYLDISIESVFYPNMPEDDSDFLRIRAKMSACTPKERRIILKTMEYMRTQFQNQ